YLGGPLVDGELHGDLILKGYGDPKITVEQWQSFIDALRGKGLTAVDGNLVLDRSLFALPPHDPAAFDREPWKPYNVGPDALLVNLKSLKLTLAPDASGSGVMVRADPPLDVVTLGAPPAASNGDCDEARVHPAIDDHGDRAAIATGGSRCSTIRITCVRCSRPTSALRAGASTARSRSGAYLPVRCRSPCSSRRRSATSS